MFSIMWTQDTVFLHPLGPYIRQNLIARHREMNLEILECALTCSVWWDASGEMTHGA